MATDLTQLENEVTRNQEVDQSAIVLLNGLSAKIEELKDNPAALQDLANRLRSSSDQLAAAVVANTPAQESPAVNPNPVPEGGTSQDEVSTQARRGQRQS